MTSAKSGVGLAHYIRTVRARTAVSVLHRVGAALAILGVVLAVSYVTRNAFRHLGGFALLAFAGLIAASIAINWRPAILFNAAFVFLALGVGEIVASRMLETRVATRYEGSYASNYFHPDTELGYGPRPEKRLERSHKLTHDGRTIYDRQYALDTHGFRVASGFATRGKIALFGCSFTFGEGVPDEQTLAAHVSRLAGQQAVNFGFHGYGPHQFLRALESDRPAAAGVTEMSAIVYTLLPDHVDRAAGRSPWDLYGPKYDVVNGQARHVGAFASRGLVSKAKEALARKSAIYGLLSARYSGGADREGQDRERVVAILKRANELVRGQYKSRLLIVLWDVVEPAAAQWEVARSGARSAWLANAVKDAGLDAIAVSGLAEPPRGERYYIPDDGHPTPDAFAAVAKGIVAAIQKR